MSLKSELLMRIKDAESAANEHVLQAEAEAQTILQDARRVAEKTLAEGRAEADAKAQALLQEVRAQADEEAKKALSSGKRHATALRKRFDAGLEGVSPRVVKLFEERL